MDQQRTPGVPPNPPKPGTARPRPAAFWLILPLIITGMMLVFYLTGDQTQRSKSSTASSGSSWTRTTSRTSP